MKKNKMKSIEKVQKYLLKHRVDENGTLDLSGMDFSNFDGDIAFCNIKAKRSIYQNYQEALAIYQDSQKTTFEIRQGNQQAGEVLTQDHQEAWLIHQDNQKAKEIWQGEQIVSDMLHQDN